MAGKSEEHRKLGKVAISKLPKFKLRLRMPHWLPDEIVHDDGHGNKDTEPLYVEEAIRAVTDANGVITKEPFQPPLSSVSSDWVLGGPLNPKQNDKFDDWLVGLCTCIRRYNRALYRLRRLHLIEEGNSIEMTPLPDDKLDPTLAEKDWTDQMAALRIHLDNQFGKACIVDMVEVNGYIVSIRAIAEVFTGNDSSAMVRARPLGPQPGGSSSSHISISSAFSSPSP